MSLLGRLLFGNLLYKLLALLVAVVLWAAVQGSRSEQQSYDLRITLENVPEDVVVVEQSAHMVNLTLRGSRAALRRVSRDVQVRTYPVSLQGVKPGEARFQVPRDPLGVPPGTEVLARSPSTIVLELEAVERKKVRVRADVVGEPPEGYRLVGYSVDPPEVLLAGARGSIRRLREVVTDRLDLSQLRETAVHEVPLAFSGSYVWPVDDDGPAVRVKVEIEPLEPEDGVSDDDATSGQVVAGGGSDLG